MTEETQPTNDPIPDADEGNEATPVDADDQTEDEPETEDGGA